jgi:hypothetical protein
MRKKSGHSRTGFDLPTEAYQPFGVDVTQIPGLGLAPLERLPFIPELATGGPPVKVPVDLDSIAVHATVPSMGTPRSVWRSGIRLVPRHCRQKRPISISARLSQLP